MRKFFTTTVGLSISLVLVLIVILLIYAWENLSGRLFPKLISQAATTDTSYSLGVLVVKYFPLTTDGQHIDITVTGDVGDLYSVIRQRTVDVTNNLRSALERGSRYLGYKDSTSQPGLFYQIVDNKEYTQATPMLADGTRRPNYYKIMVDHNICNYVESLGVREVWLWAYQGPTYPGSIYPYLNISESKMAGPFGDISNSPRYNDMPQCRNTYRVYTFNYGRGTAEALESWGHQIEVEISAVDSYPFRSLWQGPNYPQTLGVTGRCGSVHNPPNARWEYDRGNTNPWPSDCLDWNPDSLGTLSSISCSNWGCQELGDNNNPSLNYMVWNWQNMPGRGNTKTYQGKKFRNWWDVHGDFDNVMGTSRSLFLTTQTPAPTPKPTPSPTPSGDATPPTVLITSPPDGSLVERTSTVTITASASDNIGVTKVEFLVNNKLQCTDTTSPYTCDWKVPGKPGATHTLEAKATDTAGNFAFQRIRVTSSPQR